MHVMVGEEVAGDGAEQVGSTSKAAWEHCRVVVEAGAEGNCYTKKSYPSQV